MITASTWPSKMVRIRKSSRQRNFGSASVFQKKKDRTVVAEFDGTTYKKRDVLFAMRPLRDYTKLNSTMALRIPDF